MEEQQERRNVGEIELEGGQPSRNSGQTGPEPKEHRIDFDEISPRVTNWIASVKNGEERTQSQTQWPRIPKVPLILRGNLDFKKFYEPRVISFGPYHHGKSHLSPGEMIKPQCAQEFLADSNQKIEDLYKKIKSKIEKVRNCYDWSSTKEYDDEKLAWMMLLDGCFLLHLIHCVVSRKESQLRGLNVKDRFITSEDPDLFLLENQLPFGVLKLISKRASLPMEDMIKQFVTNTKGSTSEIQLEGHSHLLDLLRSALLGRFKMIGRSQPEQKQQPEKKGKSSSSSQGRYGWFCVPFKKGKQLDNWQSFRHFRELKAAAIDLQPRGTSFLTDVSFHSYCFYGYLNLAPIIIDGTTKPMFLNIVAYEMCLDGPDDHGFTSYICFLNNLIDHADDVKELRSKRILYNGLGSDEEVVQTFNEIYADWVDLGAYEEVRTSIQKHCDRKVNTWIAQALHDHFSFPWIITDFIGAVLMLFLYGVQTYYALRGN
ncbi:hypothetical protein AAG906_017071 [Vitis piasezkii]